MSIPQVLDRYWHTLRSLRPEQIYYRLVYHLYRPRISTSSSVGLRPMKGHWSPAISKPDARTGAFEFRFLNHTAAPDGWDDPSLSKLWRYNLHYFDYLLTPSLSSESSNGDLIEFWIDENKPTSGTGWEPYPTSLRIVNWIKYWLGGGRLSENALRSLAAQARWLRRRVERHLLGNHILANGKALVFAGTFFEGQEADEWRSHGLSILGREIPEQICSDGGHYERSPMYHAIVLEDFLDLVNLGKAFEFSETSVQFPISAMRSWLLAMTHPDGRISFFNDAALGIAPSLAELEAYAERLDFPPRLHRPASLPHSGYERLEVGEAVLVADVAPLGPDYLPAHGHADTLSFELSIDGQRVFVNSGTSVYGTGYERLRQRGTAAHNTLVVDERNSSDVWAGFRVGRRAKVRNVQRQDGVGACCLQAEHDGYAHLSGRVTHRRRWCLAEGQLQIRDMLQGTFRTARAMFHLHPDIAVLGEIEARLALRLPDGRTLSVGFSGGEPTVTPSTYHPEFGASVSNRVIVVPLKGPVLETTISWRT